jgi:hypothetical protein
MAALNIDAALAVGSDHATNGRGGPGESVRLANGCICCTLRADMIKEVRGRAWLAACATIAHPDLNVGADLIYALTPPPPSLLSLFLPLLSTLTLVWCVV